MSVGDDFYSAIIERCQTRHTHSLAHPPSHTFLFTVTSVEIVSAAGAKIIRQRMKRRRATDAASRPVDGEVVDVSADSEREVTMREFRIAG